VKSSSRVYDWNRRKRGWRNSVNSR